MNYKFGKRTNKWLGHLWMYDQSLLLTKTKDFCFSCCSQFFRRSRLLVCVCIRNALLTKADHLPLPSPLEKSSPPSNCLGAMIALKPAWALAAHHAVSPMSDCDRALTVLPQVPSFTGLLLLCLAHIDELSASAERTSAGRMVGWAVPDRDGNDDEACLGHKAGGPNQADSTMMEKEDSHHTLTRTETANVMAKKIIKIFPKFGMPQVIMSNNRPAFVAQVSHWESTGDVLTNPKAQVR